MNTVEACKYCQNPIRWLKREGGRPVPVEAHTASPADVLFHVGRGHMDHNNFCTEAPRRGRRRAS